MSEGIGVIIGAVVIAVVVNAFFGVSPADMVAAVGNWLMTELGELAAKASGYAAEKLSR